MGLFSKKVCAECGKEFTLLGSKLADGNSICIDCKDKHESRYYLPMIKKMDIAAIKAHSELKASQEEKGKVFKGDVISFDILTINSETHEFKFNNEDEVFNGDEINGIVFNIYQKDKKFKGNIIFLMVNPYIPCIQFKVKFKGSFFSSNRGARKQLAEELYTMSNALGVDEKFVVDHNHYQYMQYRKAFMEGFSMPFEMIGKFLKNED